MHEHCEVVIPPTDDIEAAIASVMLPFDENKEEDREHTFWDYYVIGGRFAGAKLLAKYDKAQFEQFDDWCQAEKITVAGIQCGKQKLKPPSQIPKVDAKWNEMFPREDGVLVACPLFNHSNDQYGRDGKGTIEGDICRLAEANGVECSRVIFAGPSYNSTTNRRDGLLEAIFMLCNSQWNGLNFMPVEWDGQLFSALESYRESLDLVTDEYRAIVEPNDDWLAVTVDYHS